MESVGIPNHMILNADEGDVVDMTKAVTVVVTGDGGGHFPPIFSPCVCVCLLLCSFHRDS